MRLQSQRHRSGPRCFAFALSKWLCLTSPQLFCPNAKMLNKMPQPHIAPILLILVFLILPMYARSQCAVPMPIAPTSLTVSPSSVIGSVLITATATLTDPCNQGGIIAFPGIAFVNVAPGTPSVTITFPSGFNASQTVTEQIIAMQTSQGVFLPMPATVSAPLTIAPPTLKLAFPVAQTTGNVLLPLTITDNASPNELFPISALLEISPLSVPGFDGPPRILLDQQTQKATVMVLVPAVTQPPW
jgi:hypothetical protein